MPKQTISQNIGREGEKWFEAQLPSSWIAQRPTEDIGIDRQIVICEDGTLNGLEFRVQIKSHMHLRRRESSIVERFERQKLVQLVTGFVPTLIVVYESHSKMGYCAWLNQLVGADIDLLSAKRDNIQLRIPESRRVAPGLWPGLGHEVRGLTAALGRRVHAAERSFPILRFVHEISEALRLFDFVAENWAHRGDHQSEKAIFLHASEIVCHVNVVRAIFDLMEELPRELYSIQGLDDFATRWIESCEEFAPGFRSLVEYRQEGLLEHAMAMDIDFGSMCERRKGFVRSALDAQKQITSLGLGLTASDAPSE